MSCRTCQALRANSAELAIELDRERRLNDALVRQLVWLDVAVDDTGVDDDVFRRLMRAHHRKARDLQALKLDTRTGRNP